MATEEMTYSAMQIQIEEAREQGRLAYRQKMQEVEEEHEENQRRFKSLQLKLLNELQKARRDQELARNELEKIEKVEEECKELLSNSATKVFEAASKVTSKKEKGMLERVACSLFVKSLSFE
jgi:hypothetical protein